jgi:hypothetical protein
MGYTLGQAARAVGMSKTSIFRSIKAGRISGTKDEFGQWCIEPCELHRVYPALTVVTDSDSTAERAVTGSETGGDTALVEAMRASLLEQRISDLKTMLDDMRTQRDDMRGQRDAWQCQAETSQRALTDQREKAATPPKQTWWHWLRATG